MDVKSLKTLKDVCHWIPLNFDIDDDAFLARDLKDAAREYIKELEKDIVVSEYFFVEGETGNLNPAKSIKHEYTIDWIKHFFNLDIGD